MNDELWLGSIEGPSYWSSDDQTTWGTMAQESCPGATRSDDVHRDAGASA